MLTLCSLLLFPLALALDHAFGEPPARWHPVVCMGRAADFFETFWRARAEAWGRGNGPALLCAGLLAALCVLFPFVLTAYAVTCMAQCLHPALGFFLAACTLWLCLAPRCLAEHAEAVRGPLTRGDLTQARSMLGRMVGRRTDVLDRHAVCRACVESVAENCVDGVTATLFWGLAGFVPEGFAGCAALCVAQRAANTLDAMWGRRSDRYRSFGCFAARLDDMLNFLPARLALPCISLAALITRGCDWRAAWTTGLKYHAAHESPNSAWSEAAFAGALRLKLGGPALYPAGLRNHPWIGEDTPDAEPQHIVLSVRLMRRAVWLMAFFCALAACVSLV